MKLAQWTAYACFGVAGMAVILAITNEAPAFLSATLAGVVMGVAFLAAHQGLLLLTDIRNALTPPQVADQSVTVISTTMAAPSARSASEIASDIAAMKARA